MRIVKNMEQNKRRKLIRKGQKGNKFFLSQLMRNILGPRHSYPIYKYAENDIDIQDDNMNIEDREKTRGNHSRVLGRDKFKLNIGGKV